MAKVYKVGLTGHRPKDLGGYDKNNPIAQYVLGRIRESLIRLVARNKRIEAICGMALGADQYFAEICIELSIPFHAYIPFTGQELSWPEESQEYYQYLLNKAKTVKIISEGSYSPKKMYLRNISMVDDADIMLVIYNHKGEGGTAHCYDYIKKIGKASIVINPNDYKDK